MGHLPPVTPGSTPGLERVPVGWTSKREPEGECPETGGCWNAVVLKVIVVTIIIIIVIIIVTKITIILDTLCGCGHGPKLRKA